MTLLNVSSTALVVLCVVLPVVALLLGAVGALIGYRAYQSKKLGAAKQTANKMVEDAVNEVKEKRLLRERPRRNWHANAANRSGSCAKSNPISRVTSSA